MSSLPSERTQLQSHLPDTPAQPDTEREKERPRGVSRRLRPILGSSSSKKEKTFKFHGSAAEFVWVSLSRFWVIERKNNPSSYTNSGFAF